MKQSIILLVMCITGISFTNAQSKDNTPQVPYQLAKRYFIKNTYPDKEFHILKITNEQELNQTFGVAAVMGIDGQPTNIDFSKSYVVALINSTNNRTKEIKINSIEQNNTQLNISYTLIESPEDRGANFRICELVILDKKYEGYIIVNNTGSNKEPMVGADLDEFGCKPSTGYTWSIIENSCIAPYNTTYILEGANINEFGNAALIIKDKKAEIIGSHYGKNIVLTKNKDNSWTYSNLTLHQVNKNQFILKYNNQEVGIGKLRVTK